MTVITALVSKDGCPFSGKKVRVAASFQQFIDELRTLRWRVICEKIPGFLERGETPGNIDGDTAKKGPVIAGL